MKTKLTEEKPTESGKKGFGPNVGQIHRFGVDELASKTGTDRIVAAALKTAYGWDENTLLSLDEYERSRKKWLAEKE